MTFGVVKAKKLKIKELGAKGYLFDISMGRDGVLWNLTNSNVFQYSEKKKEFLRYNASNFKDKRQKFLGLPSNVTASSIISDNDPSPGPISRIESLDWSETVRTIFSNRFLSFKKFCPHFFRNLCWCVIIKTT